MDKNDILRQVLNFNVAYGNDVVVIKGQSDHLYVTVVSDSGYLKEFYYQNKNLTFIGGNHVTVDDVVNMRNLDIS